MGDGEGRRRIEDLGNPEGGLNKSSAHPSLMTNNQPVAWGCVPPIIHLFFNDIPYSESHNLSVK